MPRDADVKAINDAFGAAGPGSGGLPGHAAAGRPRGGGIQAEMAVPLRRVLKGGNRAAAVPRPDLAGHARAAG